MTLRPVLSLHRRLLAFDHWANLVALDAVAPAADRVPKAVERLNHILGASRVWLGRVSGQPPPFGLEVALDVRELGREFEAARAGWDQFLATQTDDDLSHVIAYGNAQRVALGDILAHLPLHGQQHRGQINVDLRAAGIAPPSIDYVHAARQGRL